MLANVPSTIAMKNSVSPNPTPSSHGANGATEHSGSSFTQMLNQEIAAKAPQTQQTAQQSSQQANSNNANKTNNNATNSDNSTSSTNGSSNASNSASGSSSTGGTSNTSNTGSTASNTNNTKSTTKSSKSADNDGTASTDSNAAAAAAAAIAGTVAIAAASSTSPNSSVSATATDSKAVNDAAASITSSTPAPAVFDAAAFHSANQDIANARVGSSAGTDAGTVQSTVTNAGNATQINAAADSNTANSNVTDFAATLAHAQSGANSGSNSDANPEQKGDPKLALAATPLVNTSANDVDNNTAATFAELVNSPGASLQTVKSANQNLSAAQLEAIAPVLTAPVSATNVDTSNTAAASNTIAPRVGSADWSEAVGQKISWMVTGGQQSASLTLNPPNLGPMQVVISVNNQHASATFTSHQPEVRAALESAIPKLREMMGQSGIQLGDCNVNSQSKQPQEFAQRKSSSSNSGFTIDGIAGAVSVLPASTGGTTSGVGLVDTFV